MNPKFNVLGMLYNPRIVFLMLALFGIFGTAMQFSAGAPTGANQIPCTINTIYTDVQDTIYVLGIMLMILGGAVYAAAHIMPGQSKGTLQGYGMGLLMGGIIGIIIALLVPFIFSVLTGNSTPAFNSVQFGC